MDPSTEDLVCLYLVGHDPGPEGEPVPDAVTVPGIGDALDIGTSVAARTELLADLQALREAGLVSERVRPSPPARPARDALTGARDQAAAADLRRYRRECEAELDRLEDGG